MTTPILSEKPKRKKRALDGTSIASDVGAGSLHPEGESAHEQQILVPPAATTAVISTALEREIGDLRGMQKLLSENLTYDQMRALILKKMQVKNFDVLEEYVREVQGMESGEKKVRALERMIEILSLKPKDMEETARKKTAMNAFQHRPTINVTVNKGAALNIAPSNTPYKPEDYKGLEPSNTASNNSSVLEADLKKKALEAARHGVTVENEDE